MKKFRTVRGLLRDSSRWTKNVMAKTKSTGQQCDVHHPDASCFCIYGAICKIYPNDDTRIAAIKKLKSLLPAPFSTMNLFGMTCWNDDPARTHAEVLKLATKAKI